MISVAMCTYNGERFLADQLNSILTQTLPPDEIIICDDGSRDRTMEIGRDILSRWGGMFEIVQNDKNLGFVKNFEKAICLCHGDIIFLSDQDDVWLPEKIEKMMALFQDHPDTVLVFHDAELVDEQLRVLDTSFWKILGFEPEPFLHGDYRQLVDHNVVQGSACAFRRELAHRAIPFPESCIHDEWLALVSLDMGKIIPLPLSLMKYRQWGHNALGAGGALTIMAKVRKWLLSLHKASDIHYQNLMRRCEVMELWEARRRGAGKGRYPELLTCVDELKKRRGYLQRQDIRVLFHGTAYFTVFPIKSRAMREYIKDVLAVLLHVGG